MSERLRQIVLEEIEATLRDLPAELRSKAAALPITIEPKPNEHQVADGIEPDTLGLFVGPPYAEVETTPFPIPPQVMLFVDNLWDFAEQDEEIFRFEVRTTLMHEFGHYLGLDEDDLWDRGLE